MPNDNKKITTLKNLVKKDHISKYKDFDLYELNEKHYEDNMTEQIILEEQWIGPLFDSFFDGSKEMFLPGCYFREKDRLVFSVNSNQRKIVLYHE